MTKTFRPVVITTGRHPFEVMVLVAAVVCGVALAVTGISTRSLTAAMPGAIQVAWNTMLILGGGIARLGVFSTARFVVRLGIEAAGVMILGAACAMYSIALFTVSGLQAIPAGSFVTAVGLASVVRAWQIIHDIKRAATAAQQDDGFADVPLLIEEE